MLGEMTNVQISQLLASQVIGRIGCHADGKTYVVPVAYALDGEHIYAHSRNGLKVSMMRKNPNVCFQVDAIENMRNWRCVIVNGVFEELKTSALQMKAYKLLNDRLSPMTTSRAAKPSLQPPPGEKRMRPVYYRISIKEKSGRFEKDG